MREVNKLKKDFKRIFDILMNGSAEEYKEAKKEIERIYYSRGSIEFRKAATVALDYLNKFDKIKNIKNKEAFLSGLSLFFLVLSDEYFDELKNFTLKVIQDPNGHIREAIRKTSDWLSISLSDRMEPFVFSKGKSLNEKQKKDQVRARERFKVYLAEVEDLLDKYYLSENEDAEYVEDMKPSVEKSVQMLWSRLSELSKYAVKPSPEILKKRKEIERELSRLVNKYNTKLSVRKIREIVYEEYGQDDFNKIITTFKSVENISELNKILKTLNDVWNYFPHKSLGGLSPHEKLLEYLN